MRVRTPVALLRSLSGRYPWERYEPPYPPSYVLCFDLLTRPKMPFKVMHRKEVTHSNGSYERKSRGRKLADEMGQAKKNSHGTLQSEAPDGSDL